MKKKKKNKEEEEEERNRNRSTDAICYVLIVHELPIIPGSLPKYIIESLTAEWPNTLKTRPFICKFNCDNILELHNLHFFQYQIRMKTKTELTCH